MELSFSRVGVPRGRGKVERFFRTINTMFLQELPGFIKNKKTIKLLTLEDLITRFHDWLLTTYHNKVHSTIKQKPIEMWNQSVFLPNMPSDLDLLLLHVGKGEHLTNDSILDARTLFVTAPTVRPSVLFSQLQNFGRDLLWTQEGYKGKRDGKSKEEKHELFSSAIRKGAFYSVDLIIVDEIDLLKLQTLEILRDIYDQNDVGMVFIGMQGIEKRLSRYPQLYSRVGFSHEFKKLTPTEMHHILEYKWKEIGLSVSYEDFEDYDAVNRIIKLSNGNFRLVQRIFTQIDRIMEINNLDKITTEVIDTARDSLVIGFTE
nr:AAA family ATPase [Bacillus cereus]